MAPMLSLIRAGHKGSRPRLIDRTAAGVSNGREPGDLLAWELGHEYLRVPEAAGACEAPEPGGRWAWLSVTSSSWAPRCGGDLAALAK